jgi:hypothetical protein
MFPLLGILTTSEFSHIGQFPIRLESDTSIDYTLRENSTCIRDAEIERDIIPPVTTFVSLYACVSSLPNVLTLHHEVHEGHYTFC